MTNAQFEAIVRFDYPWEHMTDCGRDSVRDTARAAIAAAYAQNEG